MQISRRVTNGLAWTGLLLVVGVPSADIISAQVMGEGTPVAQAAVVGKPVVIEPATRPLDELPQERVAEAKVAPVPADRPERAQVASVSGDPVDRYLESGRELPSYISGGSEAQTAAAAESDELETASVAPQQTQPGKVPATQAPSTKPLKTASADETATPATAAPAVGDPIDPVEVASIGPGEPATTKVVPVPMPLAMRPTPTTRPTVIEEPSTIAREALIIPDDGMAEFPVIVRENDGFPVVPPAPVAGPDNIVSGEELEEWESGPLSDFLAERGGGEPEFDSDGFFLDEGPGSSATYRRRQLPPDVVYVYPLN